MRKSEICNLTNHLQIQRNIRNTVAILAQAQMSVKKPSPLKPSAAALRDDPLPVGPEILLHAFRRFLGRLDSCERHKVKCWLQRPEGRLMLATACSGGSELPSMAWKAFAQVAACDLGVDVLLAQSFACENDHRKQKLIRKLFPEIPKLFVDACQLGSETAMDCIAPGSQSNVPGSHILVAGFPCTDISALNTSASHAENRSCVLSGSLRTGSVFAGLAAYIAAHSQTESKRQDGEVDLEFVLLENVVALATPPKPPPKPKPKPKAKVIPKKVGVPKLPKPPKPPKPKPPMKALKPLSKFKSKAARAKAKARRVAARTAEIEARRAKRQAQIAANAAAKAAKVAAIAAAAEAKQAEPVETAPRPSSNLEVCASLLRNQGWHLFAFRLCPTMFGVPQFRDRIYMPVFPESKLASMELTPIAAEAKLHDVFSRFVGSKPQALDDYLLAETDPYILVEHDRLQQEHKRKVKAELTRPKKSARAGSKWIDSAIQRGGAWWQNFRPDSTVMATFPGLLSLTEREWEILKKVGVVFPEVEPGAINLSPSDKLREKVFKNKTPCITTRARPYLTHRCRVMHAVEALRLQNIWYSPDNEAWVCSELGKNFGFDLAGNAMEGVSLSAAIMASVVLMSNDCSGGSVAHSVAPPAQAAAAESSESDDDGFKAIWQRRR